MSQSLQSQSQQDFPQIRHNLAPNDKNIKMDQVRKVSGSKYNVEGLDNSNNFQDFINRKEQAPQHYLNSSNINNQSNNNMSGYLPSSSLLDLINQSHHNTNRNQSQFHQQYQSNCSSYRNSERKQLRQSENYTSKSINQNKYGLKLKINGSNKELEQKQNIQQIKDAQQQNYIWKHSAFYIINQITKFTTNLKKQIPQKRFTLINRNSFEVFEDRASNYNVYKFSYSKQKQKQSAQYCFSEDKTSCCQRLKYSLMNTIRRNIKCANNIEKKIENTSLAIYPDSKIKLLWDSVILLLLIVNFFYIPIKVAWKGGDITKENEEFYIESWQELILESIPQYAFIIDIIICFNTAFYQAGRLITNHTQIINHYLKGRFFWDFIIIMPYIISTYFEVPYVNAILLLRQKKIRIIMRSYEDQINLRENKKGFYDLCKLVLFILYIAHFTGCLFYFLGDWEIQKGREENWLVTNNLDNAHFIDQYSASLYWAVITMITVGYGDITPQTTIERQYVIVATMISCGVFAYSVNSIGEIVQSMTLRETVHRDTMSLLTTHMRKRGMDQQIQMRVKNYFEYLFEENIKENEKAEEIMDNLCGSIKRDVNHYVYYKELMKHKLFYLNFSKVFLYELTNIIKERWVGPEEQIIKKNQISEAMYILQKGEIEVFVKSKQQEITSEKTIKILKKGDLFGDEEFFTDEKTKQGVKTLNVVQLMVIDRKEFLELIKKFPLDYQKFLYLKEHIVFKEPTIASLPNKKYLELIKQKPEFYERYLYSLEEKPIYRRNIRLILPNQKCMICNKFLHNYSTCPILNYIPNKDKVMYQYWQGELQQNERYQNFERNKYKVNPFTNMFVIIQQVLLYITKNNTSNQIEQLFENNQYLNELAQQYFLMDSDLENSDNLNIQLKSTGLPGNNAIAQSMVPNLQSYTTNKDNKTTLSKSNINNMCYSSSNNNKLKNLGLSKQDNNRKNNQQDKNNINLYQDNIQEQIIEEDIQQSQNNKSFKQLQINSPTSSQIMEAQLGNAINYLQKNNLEKKKMRDINNYSTKNNNIEAIKNISNQHLSPQNSKNNIQFSTNSNINSNMNLSKQKQQSQFLQYKQFKKSITQIKQNLEIQQQQQEKQQQLNYNDSNNNINGSSRHLSFINKSAFKSKNTITGSIIVSSSQSDSSNVESEKIDVFDSIVKENILPNKDNKSKNDLNKYRKMSVDLNSNQNNQRFQQFQKNLQESNMFIEMQESQIPMNLQGQNKGDVFKRDKIRNNTRQGTYNNPNRRRSITQQFQNPKSNSNLYNNNNQNIVQNNYDIEDNFIENYQWQILSKFDRIKDFEVYFKESNIGNVLERLYIYQQKKKKKKIVEKKKYSQFILRINKQKQLSQSPSKIKQSHVNTQQLSQIKTSND